MTTLSRRCSSSSTISTLDDPAEAILEARIAREPVPIEADFESTISIRAVGSNSRAISALRTVADKPELRPT